MLGEHGEGGEITHVEHCQGGRASRWEHEPAPPRGLSDTGLPQPAPTHTRIQRICLVLHHEGIYTHIERERGGAEYLSGVALEASPHSSVSQSFSKSLPSSPFCVRFGVL